MLGQLTHKLKADLLDSHNKKRMALSENTQYQTPGVKAKSSFSFFSKPAASTAQAPTTPGPEPYAPWVLPTGSPGSAERFVAGNINNSITQDFASAPKPVIEPLPPGYASFLPADVPKTGAPRWVEPTEQTGARNWPEHMGGGQYAIDPSQPGQMIKSGRTLLTDPAVRKRVLRGLSNKFFQIDHTIPLWAGGLDAESNLQVISIPKHMDKTRAQAVALTLLAKGKISLNEAKAMAFTWQDKDLSGIPTPDDTGYISLDEAEKATARWKDPHPFNLTNIVKEMPQAMRDFGKGWLPSPVRETAKGFLGGVSMDLIPGTEQTSEGAPSTIGHTVGNIAGFIFGFGKFIKGAKMLWGGTRGAMEAKGLIKAASITEKAIVAANTSIDIGGRGVKGMLLGNLVKRAAPSAAWMTLYGQTGITLRDLTGRQEAELGDHMKQFFLDSVFGGLTGAAGQTLKGYAGVGAGTMAISVMDGNDIQTALKDAALMTALHTMGLKNRKNINDSIKTREQLANGEVLKGATSKLSIYNNQDVVTPFRVGDKIPDVYSFNLLAVEKERLNTKELWATNFGEIKTQTDAVAFATQKSLNTYKGMVDASAMKGQTIPTEMQGKEVKSIITAGHELWKQTLPLAAREKENLKDLASAAQAMWPQVGKNQGDTLNLSNWVTKDSQKQLSKLTDNLTEIDPKKLQSPHAESSGAPKESVPIRGANMDPKDAANLAILNELPPGTPVIVVRGENVSPYLRMKNMEAIARGEKPTIVNPDAGVRTYFWDGKNWLPTGMVSTKEGVSLYNQEYIKDTKRIKDIASETDSQTFFEKLKSDPSHPRDLDGTVLSKSRAQDLFEIRDQFDALTGEQLMGKRYLNSKFPIKEYKEDLMNNEILTKFMEEKNTTIIFAKKGKSTISTKAESTTGAGKGTGKYFSTIDFDDTSLWDKTFNFRDANKNRGARTIVAQPEAEALPSVPRQPKQGVLPVPGIKPKNIHTEAKKTGVDIESKAFMDKSEQLTGKRHLDDMTSTELNKMKEEVVVGAKPIYDDATGRYIAPGQPLAAPTSPVAAPKSTEGSKTPKGFVQKINDALAQNRITKLEARGILSKKSKLDSLNKKASSEYLTRSDKTQYDRIQRDMSAFLKSKKLMKVATEPTFRGGKPKIKPYESPFRGETFQEGQGASGWRELQTESLIDEGWTDKQITELLGSKNFSKYISPDQGLAKKYDLKLNDKGFLEMNQSRQPVFSEEGLKKYGVSEGASPIDTLVGLKKDFEAFNKAKTVHVESFIGAIDKGSKEGPMQPFYQSIRKIIDMVAGDPKGKLSPQNLEERLASPLNPRIATNWKLNSLFSGSSRFMKDLLKTTNPEGHFISQPRDRYRTKDGTEEQLKRIDEKTLAAEDIARESGQGLVKDQAVIFTQKNMSVAPITELEKLQDLTKLESIISSLVSAEVTGKPPTREQMIKDGVRWGKNLVSGYDASIREGAKTQKAFVSPTGWKAIEKYLLENIPDGAGGKSPDGTGGLGDALGNTKDTIMKTGRKVSDYFTGTVRYVRPADSVPPTDFSPTNPVLATNFPTFNSVQHQQLLSTLKDDNQKKTVATIAGEALGEGPEGLQSVYNVMINRAKKIGTDDLYKIASAPSQFTAFSADNPIYSRIRDYLRGKKVNLTDQEKNALSHIIQMVNTGAEDITGGATHYANVADSTDLSWINKYKKLKDIGKHSFFIAD